MKVRDILGTIALCLVAVLIIIGLVYALSALVDTLLYSRYKIDLKGTYIVREESYDPKKDTVETKVIFSEDLSTFTYKDGTAEEYPFSIEKGIYNNSLLRVNGFAYQLEKQSKNVIKVRPLYGENTETFYLIKIPTN